MALDRWPPVYDADELAGTIRELVASERLFAEFYDDLLQGPPVCQGDVVRLASHVPLIDRTGQPVADFDVDFWLVIGNTCDFERDPVKVPWTQVVPIFDFSTEGTLSEDEQAALRRYQTSRAFYLPPWRGQPAGSCLVADLCRTVTAEKAVFDQAAHVVARLREASWVLLHSCLIRFLCRDDGRFDA